MNAYDKQFIGGVWREGRGEAVLSNLNPFTGETLYTYRAASRADLDDAYQAAKAAQKDWAALLPAERQAYLERLAPTWTAMREEILEVQRAEGGFTRAKADYEFGCPLEFMRLAVSYPLQMNGLIQPSNLLGKENYIYRSPKGVIGVIAPWNVPLVLALRSVLPAVAMGNGVVLKPSSDTPAAGFLVGELFDRAGFPKGLVNVIAGRGADIGDAFVTHPVPAAISFTGSTEVGRRIGSLAGGLLKEASLELGGNNAMLVLADADLDLAANNCAWSACFNAGQVCMAVNRVIVLDQVYDAFVEKLVRAVSALRVGDPADPQTDLGPMINRGQLEKAEGYIRETLAAGAKAALEGRSEGNLMYPWVLTEVTNDMPTARNEVFAPVCSVLRAADEEEALALANDTEYGLSGCVYTADRYHGMELARRLESGMAHVNDQSINDEPHVLFGGDKQSGLGRFNGSWVLDKFTTQKWVSVQNTPRLH